MQVLSLDAVAVSLAECLAEAIRLQRVEAAPDAGAYINPSTGLADPSHAGTPMLVTGAACLYLAARRGAAPIDSARLYLSRAEAAMDFLLRAQRPSGRTDLQTCNYDSAPDTAFILQEFTQVLRQGRTLASEDPAWRQLLDRIERFTRRAADGLIDGGFHTPNHRWVLAAAMAQVQSLFPDYDATAAIDALLAEGFDLDADGFYQERSSGVYDAVTNRSLLLLHACRPCPSALEAVRRNLEANLYLLHADGTVETGLSRRQDLDWPIVPLRLAPAAWSAAAQTGDGRLAALARRLWTATDRPSLGEACALAFALLEHSPAEVGSAELPEQYVRWFPGNRLWRHRAGPLSVSAFGDTPRLLHLKCGAIHLASVRVRQAYFGRAGDFVADRMEPTDGGVLLHSSGAQDPRRPAYDLPLGRPVAPGTWDAEVHQRRQRRMPAAGMTLRVAPVLGGLDLHLRTVGGLDGVAAAMVLDLSPGVHWETPGTLFQPVAGQVILFRGGTGAVRCGPDRVEIGPGAGAHTMVPMRDLPDAPGHVRIALTFLTPVDHTLSLRLG